MSNKIKYSESDLASNPNTPPEVLRELAGNKFSFVRYEVACNINTPPDALMKLAGDENEVIRGSVVRNPNAPEDAIMLVRGINFIQLHNYVELITNRRLKDHVFNPMIGIPANNTIILSIKDHA